MNREAMNQSTQHATILKSFVMIMVAHWLEHGVQAYQVYVLGYDRHHALGLLGQFFPWLMHSEWLHFGYAVLTWLGLVFLREGFSGCARAWWDVALIIQIWHLFEHTLLFVQAQGGFVLWGAHEPTSVLQLFFPRIELHLFYNSVVTIPVIAAMVASQMSQERVSNVSVRPKTV
jgi:hypothetical protein